MAPLQRRRASGRARSRGAIRAATLDALRFLTELVEPDFGSVEVGKRADRLLVEGDPTGDVTAASRIRSVFQGTPVECRPVPPARC